MFGLGITCSDGLNYRDTSAGWHKWYCWHVQVEKCSCTREMVGTRCERWHMCKCASGGATLTERKESVKAVHMLSLTHKRTLERQFGFAFEMHTTTVDQSVIIL